MVDIQAEVEQLAHEGPQTHWIKTGEGNKEFLESVGVILGPREGDYWRLCVIPREAENDIYEHWGVGDDDSIMFGPEGEETTQTVRDQVVRERVFCSLCNSVICADGTCSYPLCPSWHMEVVEEEEATAAELEAELPPVLEKPIVIELSAPRKAARLRQ